MSALVESGRLSPREAELSRHVPVAEDITVEVDSGGHTDNRPLSALLSEIVLLRDKLAQQHGLDCPVNWRDTIGAEQWAAVRSNPAPHATTGRP